MEAEKLSETSLPSIRGEISSDSRHVLINVKQFYWLYWRFIFGILWPFLCCFLFFFGTHVGIRCLYIQVIMWFYWTFDILPEGVVSLIPIFALPILTIQDAYVTCSLYFQYGIFVMNALFMAVCIDYSQVHERITLYLMWKLGGTPRVVHAVISTMSMVISVRVANAYTVLLLIPLIKRILYEFDMSNAMDNNNEVASELKMSAVNFQQAGKKYRPVNLSMSFFYGIITASTLGGINFVTGSITNMIYRSVYQRRYPYCQIAQTAWYCYTIPISIVSFIISVIWVQILYLGLWSFDKKAARDYNLLKKIFEDEKIIEKLYLRLGEITIREVATVVAFATYLIIWYVDVGLYFKEQKEYYLVLFISDSTPYFIICFALMILPANVDFINACSSHPNKIPTTTSPSIMPWAILCTRVPWARILVIGACVAIANASFYTGIVENIMSYFTFMTNLNYWTLLFIVTLFSILITETVSNGIVCGIFAPYIIELAILTNNHPIYLSLPFALCSTIAMCTPYASLNIKNVTPVFMPNRKDLFFAGIVPKISAWLLVFVTFDNYGKLIFNKNVIDPANFQDRLNMTSCFCQPCTFNTTREFYW